MQSRVTIIREDKAVYVDGDAEMDVDCSELPEYFHALQWYGNANPPYGEIEFAADANGRKLPNVRFSDFKAFEFMTERRALKRADRLKPTPPAGPGAS